MDQNPIMMATLKRPPLEFSAPSPITLLVRGGFNINLFFPEKNKSDWPLVHAYYFSQIFLDGNTNDFRLTKNNNNQSMFYYMFVKLLSAICYYLLLLLLKCLSLNPDFLVLRD